MDAQSLLLPAVLDQVDTARARHRHRCHLLTAATALIVGLIAPATPGAALARQDDGFAPTTFPDEPIYNEPAYEDPNNTLVNEPAYDEPAYEDPNNTVFNEPAYDETVDDTFSGDPCNPAVYPDWASDPYCNPQINEFQNTTTSPAATPSPGRFDTALTTSADTPLIELEASEAPVIGAGRMLLAIDAIAELGGFERATTPGGANLLRDIRDGIPSVGLDEDGLTLELEQFIDDFIPFLESLEANGVRVSDDLWDAALTLEAVVDADNTSGPEAIDLVEPRPWLGGLADLLVRGGESSPTPTPESDAIAVRELLASFAVSPTDAEETTTTAVTPEAAPPTALALETEPEPASSASSSAPLLLLMVGLVVLFGSGAALWLSRRSSDEQSASPAVSPDAGLTAADNPANEPGVSGGPKTSVTELLDASRRMSGSLDAPTIASIAITEAKRIVDAEGGIVVRRTEHGLDPVGCEPPMLFNYEHIADGCLPRVIETGQSTAAIVHDEPLLAEVPMAMAAVPIVADGLIVGAMLVVRVSAKPFSRDELDALEMLAPHVGTAFAVSDKHESIADIEPLTGLQNRRRLDSDLADISTDQEVAYVMVDIDHFKNFNDTNGHAAGDEALRQVSALLQASVRPRDHVYRYGGEEFCVLLPGATAKEAAVVAERARAAVEAAIIPGMENQPAGVVTISVGVSDSAFGTPSDLVERADAALYESKRNGRNQITLSSDERPDRERSGP